MRTRARGPASPAASSAREPMSPMKAARRKRDSGIAGLDSDDDESGIEDLADANASGDVKEANSNRKRNTYIKEEQNEDNTIATISTPPPHKKTTKRVRFSDPFPRERATSPTPTDTGLTPYMRRSTLSPPTQPSFSQYDPRRASLPATLLPSPPTTPSSSRVQHVQFAPLRQTLDTRLRRRLRRSHLSEELNDLESDKRQLARLQTQVEEREKRIEELGMELELQRQLGIEVCEEEEERVRELRGEVDGLRKAMAVQDGEEPRSPWHEEGFFSSPRMEDAEFEFEFALPSPTEPRISTGDAGCQAALADPLHTSNIASLESAVEQLTREGEHANAALAAIRTDLSSLGFTAPDSPADDAITAIHAAFRTARLDLERALPGETTTAFENAALLPALVSHVRRLANLAADRGRALSSAEQTTAALRSHFNSTLAKLDALETSHASIGDAKAVLEDQCEHYMTQSAEKSNRIAALQAALSSAAARVSALESDAATSATTISRLQSAIKSYRAEVRSLEGLVNGLEAEKASVIAANAPAAADLEACRAALAAARDESLALRRREGELRAALVAAGRALEGGVRDSLPRLAEWARATEGEWRAVLEAVVPIAVGGDGAGVLEGGMELEAQRYAHMPQQHLQQHSQQNQPQQYSQQQQQQGNVVAETGEAMQLEPTSTLEVTEKEDVAMATAASFSIPLFPPSGTTVPHPQQPETETAMKTVSSSSQTSATVPATVTSLVPRKKEKAPAPAQSEREGEEESKPAKKRVTPALVAASSGESLGKMAKVNEKRDSGVCLDAIAEIVA